MGFFGPSFTWAIHFSSSHSVWERLDQAFATNDWFLEFAGTLVHHLHSDTFDHSPLLIIPSSLAPQPPQKPFLFEEIWLTNNGCTKIVEATWNSYATFNQNFISLHMISNCNKALTSWSKRCFGNFRHELREKRDLFLQAEHEALFSSCNSRVLLLKSEIYSLLDKEHQLWQ